MHAYQLYQFSANPVQARASLPVWTTAGRSGCSRGPGRQVGWMTLILMSNFGLFRLKTMLLPPSWALSTEDSWSAALKPVESAKLDEMLQSPKG